MHLLKKFPLAMTVFATLLTFVFSNQAHATNLFWTGSNSNDWYDAGNWSTSSHGAVSEPPRPNDAVYFNNAVFVTGPYTAPTLSSGFVEVTSVSVGVDGGYGEFLLAGSGTLKSGAVRIGRSTGGGKISISGAGVMDAAGTQFAVGEDSVGVLDMFENSSVTTTASLRVGVNVGSSGTVLMRDNASFTSMHEGRVGWAGGVGFVQLSGSSRMTIGKDAATRNFTIGYTGTGTVIVEDAAVLDTNLILMGNDADSSGTLHLRGGTINATGIARLSGSASINLNGGSVIAKGNSADFFSNMGAIAINATGVAADKSAFTFDTGVNEVIMTNTFSYNGSNDSIAFDKRGSGTLILYGASTINGIVRISNGTLEAGAANILSNARFALARNAVFDMGGFNQTFKGLANDGEIFFSTDKTNVGRKLLIDGPLSGNGVFAMSVALGAEVADTITVTGVASGTHTLQLKNLGGVISPDSKLEILTIGAGSTAVIRSNDVDGRMGTYFLTPETDTVTGEIIYGLVATGNNSIAADAIISTAASMGSDWHYSLDSLRSRFGEIRALPKPEKALTSTWYQANAYRLETQMELTTVPYDQNTYGGIFGVDRIIPRAESRILLGAYVSINRSDRTYDVFGDGNTIDHNGGLYITWLHDAGWFADFTVKGNQYKSSFAVTSVDGLHTTGDYDTWGGGFSAEFGRKYSFGRHFWVEPSVQMASAWFNGGDYVTSTGMHIEIDRSHATQYRGQVAIGTRAGKRWYPYAKVGIARSDSGGGLVHVDKQTWQTQFSGWRFEAGAGVSVTIADHSLLYLGYEYNKADLYERPWAVSLGYRRTW